jgi:aspartyl-tRNA(Asn)/glutamyl-tRNA(Gln) amidotransferase subunit C
MRNEMKIDESLLQKIASNARLQLTEKEINEFLPQLREVLDLFSMLDKVDTKNTKPSFQPINVSNVLREDVITSCLTTQEVFLNVKNRKGDYFKGPKAI